MPNYSQPLKPNVANRVALPNNMSNFLRPPHIISNPVRPLMSNQIPTVRPLVFSKIQMMNNQMRPRIVQNRNNNTMIFGGVKTNKRKSYCSVCNLWMNANFEDHQNSPGHLAKINNKNDNSVIKSNDNKSDYQKKRNKKKKNNSQNAPQIKTKLNTPLQPKPKEIIKKDINVDIDKSECGLEVLIPVEGMYCTICEVFFPKTAKAQVDHCNTGEHRMAYEKIQNRINKESLDTSDNQDLNNCNAIKKPKLDIINTSLNRDNCINTDNNVSISASTSIENMACDDTRPVSDISFDTNSTLVKADASYDFEESISAELLCPEVSLDFPDEEDYDDSDLSATYNQRHETSKESNDDANSFNGNMFQKI